MITPLFEARRWTVIGSTEALTDNPEKADLAYLKAISEIASDTAVQARVAGAPSTGIPSDEYVEEVTARAIKTALA